MGFWTNFGGALAVALTTAAGAQAETWQMPTPYPDATFHTQNDMDFAKDVAKATDGKLEIKIHSAGSLFKHPEIPRAVRSGQVQIGEFFLSIMNNDNPAFGADSLPFLATSYDQAEKLWTAQKPVIEKLLEKQGMMVLYAVPWPPQGLYTKKPIHSVKDLAGLKFRSYNATLESFAKAAGMAPTQVEVPDIPQAFSTGRVEAMITSPSTGVNSKAWDFLSYYTDIQAWLPKNIVVANKRAFDHLPKDEQKAVLEAAAKAQTRGWEMSKKETVEQTKALAAHGIHVEKPTPELEKGLKEIGAKMLTQWKQKAGAEGAELLKAYQQ
ncbi:TRAP transporter substrate-binding protein [Acidimangrovimonas sediminis]|uniref:TRAP transporter substrate-binding protein n=1 Tax=Acidimangrovimonas sediminis TaxID=2056283 RepID=UPI000C805441|nr:TRAP transporter substrate-binding protein [Acidimangrovimonas sediminis]